jgi:hypothetical protein
VGYLIQQAEGAFDINTVFAGISCSPRSRWCSTSRWRGGEAPAGVATDAERDGAAMSEPKPGEILRGALWKLRGVRVVRGSELDPNVPQTQGMARAAAVNFARMGARRSGPAR